MKTLAVSGILALALSGAIPFVTRDPGWFILPAFVGVALLVREALNE